MKPKNPFFQGKEKFDRKPASKMMKRMKQYFKRTTPAEIRRQWNQTVKETGPFEGPTVSEFFSKDFVTPKNK